MSVLRELLFLDPMKHPYSVVTKKGTIVARFSNLACAAHTAINRWRVGTVITPQGDTVDRLDCQKILDNTVAVNRFMSGNGNSIPRLKEVMWP